MLRSWADAPARSASESTGKAVANERVMSEVAIANVCADHDAIRIFFDVGERQVIDVDEFARSEDIELHEIDEGGAAGKKHGAVLSGGGGGCFLRGGALDE